MHVAAIDSYYIISVIAENTLLENINVKGKGAFVFQLKVLLVVVINYFT